MSSAAASFPRELLRKLPELLEGGSEAVLKSADAQAWLRTNPRAERMLVAVADTVGMMRQARAVRRSCRSARVISMSRPVADAATYFSMELAEVLFDHAIFRIEQAISGSKYLSIFSRRPVTMAANSQRADGLDDLASALVEGDEIKDLFSGYLTLLREQAPLSGLDVARRLLEPISQLIPRSSGARFFLLYLRELEDPRFSPAQWEEYAATADTAWDRACGLASAARLFANQGQVDRAMELDRIAAVHHSTDPTYAYLALLHAVQADSKGLAVLADRLNSFASGERERAGIAIMFRSDAQRSWRHFRATRRSAIATVLDRLEAPFVTALTGALD